MGIFDRFVNGSESDAVGFKIVNSSNPIEWGNLTSAIGGSILAGAASAAIGIPRGVAKAGEMIFGGAASTAENLVGAFFEPFVTVPLGTTGGGFDYLNPMSARLALGQIWAIAYVDELGLLAGPAAVVFVLAAAYILAVGAQQAIETFRSGGGIL